MDQMTMKTPISRSLRLSICSLAVMLLQSCSTSSLVSSRTRHVGTIHAIKECRADANRAYVLFQMEKDGPWKTSVVELDTRNTAVGRKAPASAQVLPILELTEETSAIPKGQSLPCLGIWRVHPDKPGSPFVPRVRWIGRQRDFCVNLPSKAADPGRIVSRLPMAIAQDALFVGGVVPFSVGLSTVANTFGAMCAEPDRPEPLPLASSIGDWAAGELPARVP
jgi:hypothetical protein